jgi:hypothetical protein
LAILALALLGALYYFNSTPAEPAPNPERQAPSVVADRQPSERPRVNSEQTTPVNVDSGKTRTFDGKSLVETISKMVTLTLPGNVKLDVPENSYLQTMVKYLSDAAGATEPKSWVADKIESEGAAGAQTGDSSTGVTKLATVLKAFGTAKLKITAYTDNIGQPAESKKSSLERANAIKDALVKAGVPEDRITTEGAGPDHPIASNDTDEGRAKNRRIELSIVSR